jgi:hypothetical protein
VALNRDAQTVKLVEPNVLYRPGLSVSENYGLADNLNRASPNARRIVDARSFAVDMVVSEIRLCAGLFALKAAKSRDRSATGTGAASLGALTQTKKNPSERADLERGEFRETLRSSASTAETHYHRLRYSHITIPRCYTNIGTARRRSGERQIWIAEYKGRLPRDDGARRSAPPVDQLLDDPDVQFDDAFIAFALAAIPASDCEASVGLGLVEGRDHLTDPDRIRFSPSILPPYNSRVATHPVWAG